MRYIPKIASEYLRRYRRHKVWQRVVAAVASVVVFCTTYALILPAITVSTDYVAENGEAAGIVLGGTTTDVAALSVVTDADGHGAECYETQKVLACSFEVHQHTAACYEDEDTDGELICGYADFVVHTHDEYCYDASRTLVCTLSDEYPEAHTHDADCYEAVADADDSTSTDASDKQTTGDAQDAEKTTQPDPDQPDTTGTGTDETTEANQPEQPEQSEQSDTTDKSDTTDAESQAALSDDAGDAGDQTAVQSEETAAPEEDEVQEPIVSVLSLTELAYEPQNDEPEAENGLEMELSFNEADETLDATAATGALTCGKQEIVLHTHTDEPDADGNTCYNTEGELVCGQIEVLAHQHDETCWQDVQVLTCTETHTTDATEEETPTDAAATVDADAEDDTATSGPRKAAAKVTTCEHVWENGVCTLCETVCAHEEFEGGVCTVCETVCTHEKYEGGVCTVCKTVCAHPAFEDGKCTVCKMACTHPKLDEDGKCTQCERYGASVESSGEYKATITVVGVPDGASVTAENIDSDDDVCWDAINQQEDSQNLSPLGAYNITVLDNGAEWLEDNASVDVKIDITDFASVARGATIYVLHVRHDGVLERLDATYDSNNSNCVCFTTTSFSTFVLAGDWTTMVADDDSDGGDDDGDGDEDEVISAGTYALTGNPLNSKVDNSGNISLTTNDTYYLSDNLTISGTVTIGDNAEVTINLNGYVLQRSNSNSSSTAPVITLKSGTLTIVDEIVTKTDESREHYGLVDPATYLWTYTPTEDSSKEYQNYTGVIDLSGSDPVYVKITGGIITGGKAGKNQGGGINADGGKLIINGGTIAGNQMLQGSGAGAGIKMVGGGGFEMNGGTICFNYSNYNGGGIYLKGECTINKGTIVYNKADAYGGGMRITSRYNTTANISNCVIGWNEAGKEGGGIEISLGHNARTTGNDDERKATDNISATLENVTLKNNKAGENGGGISMSENPFNSSVTGKKVILTITGSTTVSNNTAGAENTTFNGGGVYLEYGTFTLEAGTIAANTATGNGGGVYVTNGTSSTTVAYAYIYGGTIGGASTDANKAENGGGLYVDSGDVTISDGAVSYNEASTDGGGIYVNNGDVTMSGGKVNNNKAQLNGGGIAVVGTNANNLQTVTVDGNITVSNNVATTGNGGGIYIVYGQFTMSETATEAKIENNAACNWDKLNDPDYGNGGGVYVLDGEVTINGGAINGNTCSRFGGGVYVYTPKSSHVSTLKGGEIKDNKAGQCGGGVAIYKSEVKFARNTSGGVQVAGNTAVNGGGLYIRSGSKLTMYGGSITDNKAVSLNSTSETFFAEIKKATSDGTNFGLTSLVAHSGLTSVNTDDYGGNGGGVFIHNSTMELSKDPDGSATSGYIAENKADRNGGGVYALHNVGDDTTNETDNTYALSLTLKDGNIEKNKAGGNGGGIAMFANSDCNEETGNKHDHAQATLQGSLQVYDNQATNGGGFYVGGGQLTVTGGIISANKANGPEKLATAYEPDKNEGVGGGIYVYSYGTLVLDLTTSDEDGNGSLGVYSNLADGAADDVYCSPKATSDISLPKAQGMNLQNYAGYVIGRAINWFEDYPEDDNHYSYRATIEDPKGENTNKAGDSKGRYRDAEDDEAKVKFDVTNNKKTVSGYLCLTLGYEYTRVNLTVQKELAGNNTDSFDFTVTITRPDAADYPADLDGKYKLADTDELVFDKGDSDLKAQTYKVVVNGESENGQATVNEAKVTFTLKSGEYVILEGIPAYATVTITESATNAASGLAVNSNSALYIPKYELTEGETSIAQDGMTCTLQKVGTENYKVVCTNLAAGAALPQTGGSGTRKYTWCGLALMALAVGGAAYGDNRRRRRARKGAGAK
jgi:hypothetical protein